MTEATSIAKIVIIMGILFILIGALYPGQDAAWNSLRKSVSTGPTFPTFNNPFVQNFLFSSLLANASQGFTSVTGCPTNAYWKCLATNDGNKSYLTLTGAFSQFAFNLTNLDPSGMEVTQATIDVWCRSNQTQAFKVFVDSYPNDQSYAFNCPVFVDRLNASFQPVSFDLRPICPSLGTNTYCTWFSQNFTHQKIFILTDPAGPNPKGASDFTFISVNIYTNRQTPCTGSSFDTFGCQISRFFLGIANGFLFFVNGIGFVVGVIGALLIFIGGIISSLLLGLFSTMGWFINAPAPEPIKSIFAAGFLGAMGLVLLVTIKIVRGQQG